MVFSRIKRAMRSPRDTQWNSARRDLVCPSKGTVNSAQVPEERLRSQHWLSLTCYLEQIEPETLSLPLDLLRRIQGELAELTNLDPLKTYAAVLSTLSTEPTQMHERESTDAAS